MVREGARVLGDRGKDSKPWSQLRERVGTWLTYVGWLVIWARKKKRYTVFVFPLVEGGGVGSDSKTVLESRRQSSQLVWISKKKKQEEEEGRGSTFARKETARTASGKPDTTAEGKKLQDHESRSNQEKGPNKRQEEN